MTRTETKVDKLQNITNLGEQATILYLLNARIASGLENKEQGSQMLTQSIGQTWNEAAKFIDILATENPDKAFDLAITLTLLPKSPNSHQEDIYRWMRGDGPLLLTKDTLLPRLIDYLQNSTQSATLLSTLLSFLEFDFSTITQEQVFDNPNCFLATATMLLGTKLSDATDNPRITQLITQTFKRLNTPQIADTIRHYREFEDTAWIVTELEPFLAK